MQTYEQLSLFDGQGKIVDMSEQIVLRCEDSLEGIFTALFDAFVCKNKMKAHYTDSISIAAGEGEMTLFAREIEVQTDARKVQKTDLQYTVKTGVSGV